MVIETIAYDFSICKVDFSVLIPHKKFYFSAITDEEISLVCPTEEALEQAIARDDGWKAVRIRGVLDFSLVGILARISRFLAGAKIGIFAVSTFNTDYLFMKKENFERALTILSRSGYQVVRSQIQ